MVARVDASRWRTLRTDRSEEERPVATDRMTKIGTASLHGWRRTAADRLVAQPISKRTRFSEDQILALVGFALLAYTLYRVLRPMLSAARSSD